MSEDVIISWFGSVPDSVYALFKTKPRLVPMPIPPGQQYGNQFQLAPNKNQPWIIGGWPHPLRAIFQQYGISKPRRVLALGFSEGCQGVLALLKSKDAGYLEHVIMIDGLHCSWYPGSVPNESRSNIEGTCLAAATAFASLASKGPIAIGGNPPGQHYFTLTHSSIIPPSFPSTTDTAREIIARIWNDPPDVELPAGLAGMTFDPPWIANGVKYSQDTYRYSTGQNGLLIMGYSNLDPMGTADHIYQSKIVLKTVLEKLVADRWNDQDPSVPTCTTGTGSGSTGGPSCNPNAPVTIPDDFFSNPTDASLDWLAWVKEAQEKPSVNMSGILLSGLIGGAVGLGIKEGYEFLKRRWAKA